MRLSEEAKRNQTHSLSCCAFPGPRRAVAAFLSLLASRPLRLS